MSITLNGKNHPIPGPLTVRQLLDSLNLAGKPVVVELNQRALTPAEHLTASVTDGATVEIVVLAAGG